MKKLLIGLLVLGSFSAYAECEKEVDALEMSVYSRAYKKVQYDFLKSRDSRDRRYPDELESAILEYTAATTKAQKAKEVLLSCIAADLTTE